MPDSELPKERRKHPRAWAKLRIFSRRLLPQELGQILPSLGTKNPTIPDLAAVDPDAADGVLQMIATDVSQGGINATGDLDLVGPDAFNVGDDYVVEVDLEDGKPRMRAIGRVTWTSKREPGLARSGLVFVALSEASMARLKAYLEKQKVDPIRGKP